MRLEVYVKNPLIYVKPDPEAKEYMYVNLGLISVNNKMEKSPKRVITK